MLESTLRRLIFAKMAAGEALVEAAATGNPLTFLTEKAKPLKSLLIPFTPVQSGTGDPSPENVRPIVGLTGLTAWRTGKNLLNDVKRYEATETTVYFGETVGGEYSTRLKAGIYTISVDFDEPYGMYYREKDDTANRTLWNSSSAKTELTFTVEKDGYFRFWAYRNAQSGGIDLSKVHTVMLNYGETALPYSPYTGESFPVDWTDEAGTVYGGTLDLVTGVLTVEWEAVDLGQLNWGASSVSRYYNTTQIQNFKIATTTAERQSGMMCEIYPFSQSAGYNDSMTDGSMLRGNSDSTQIYIRDTNYATKEELKTALNNVMLAYELATPYTVQLDPVTVNALVGDNTIWSDTNGSNTAVYLKKA